VLDYGLRCVNKFTRVNFVSVSYALTLMQKLVYCGKNLYPFLPEYNSRSVKLNQNVKPFCEVYAIISNRLVVQMYMEPKNAFLILTKKVKLDFCKGKVN